MLYEIETNAEFPVINVDETSQIVAAANEFGLSFFTDIVEIEKKNRSSNIYCGVAEDSTRYIIRRCNASLSILTEQQASALASVEHTHTLTPRMNLKGQFVSVLGDSAWVCYPFIEGELFGSVESHDLLVVVTEAYNFLSALAAYGESNKSSVSEIIHVDTRSEDWSNLAARMVAAPESKIEDAYQKELGLDLLEVLRETDSWWKNIVSLGQEVDFEQEFLVHYDLQAANVIMNPKGPAFIDMEDICFANDQISLAHLVFKLLRHMIWLRPSRRNEVCQHILPAVLEKLDSLGCSDLAEREKIAAHAFAHTLSDLAAIMHLTFESGRQDLLYDVRKKVLNIFEIADIFGISQGNPLQMNLYRNQAST